MKYDYFVSLFLVDFKPCRLYTKHNGQVSTSFKIKDIITRLQTGKWISILETSSRPFTHAQCFHKEILVLERKMQGNYF